MDLISLFDQALDSLINYPTLILDLTDAFQRRQFNQVVMSHHHGRFYYCPMPYQQHEYDEKTLRHAIDRVCNPRKRLNT